jgi:hypothetical protein
MRQKQTIENKTFSFINSQYSSKLFSTVIIPIIFIIISLVFNPKTTHWSSDKKSANSAKPKPKFLLHKQVRRLKQIKYLKKKRPRTLFERLGGTRQIPVTMPHSNSLVKK